MKFYTGAIFSATYNLTSTTYFTVVLQITYFECDVVGLKHHCQVLGGV